MNNNSMLNGGIGKNKAKKKILDARDGAGQPRASRSFIKDQLCDPWVGPCT
jgi:hypothetical protein